MKIISWNVNGIRSNIVDTNTAKYKKPRIIAENSPLDKIISQYDPDIICFQETRLDTDLYHLFQSPEILEKFPHQYWSSSQGDKHRGGNRYSGTAIWSKYPAIKVLYDIPELQDREGRFIQLEFEHFILITTYTPNTGSNWKYRLEHWEPAIRKHLVKLSEGELPLIYCGDNNIANKNDVWFGKLLDRKFNQEEDPKEKKKLLSKIKSKKKFHTGQELLCGYSKEERAAYKHLLEEAQLIDAHRKLYPDNIDQFTYFSIRIKNSFQDNQGWIIDRFLITEKHQELIQDSKILSEIGVRNSEGVFLSDHLPIYLQIEV